MRFVPRSGWQARPPRSRVSATPGYGGTVHYEGPAMGSFGHESCASKVRGIQNFHMDQRDWSDIAYTAMVCPHGYTFECRWVGIRNGANGTDTGNRDAYAVCCLVGVGDPIPDVMVTELVEVLAYLDEQGAAGANVNGHRDWKATACPGDPLYGRLADIRNRKAALIAGPPPALEDEMPTVVAVDLVVNPTNPGQGYKLDAIGGLHPFGGAPSRGIAAYSSWLSQGLGPARRVVVTNWSTFAGYVLDAIGGIHPFGGAPTLSTPGYWPNAFVPPAPSV